MLPSDLTQTLLDDIPYVGYYEAPSGPGLGDSFHSPYTVLYIGCGFDFWSVGEKLRPRHRYSSAGHPQEGVRLPRHDPWFWLVVEKNRQIKVGVNLGCSHRRNQT